MIRRYSQSPVFKQITARFFGVGVSSQDPTIQNLNEKIKDLKKKNSAQQAEIENLKGRLRSYELLSPEKTMPFNKKDIEEEFSQGFNNYTKFYR